MQKLNIHFFAAIALFFIPGLRSIAQDYSAYQVREILLRTQPGEFVVYEGADSLFARYLDVSYTFDRSGAAVRIELYNISDTANVQQMTANNYAVPSSDVHNEDLYSVSKAGTDISISLGQLSLLHRYRLKLWLDNSEDPVYTTEF